MYAMDKVQTPGLSGGQPCGDPTKRGARHSTTDNFSHEPTGTQEETVCNHNPFRWNTQRDSGPLNAREPCTVASSHTKHGAAAQPEEYVRTIGRGPTQKTRSGPRRDAPS